MRGTAVGAATAGGLNRNCWPMLMTLVAVTSFHCASSR
jgi:hypothetical protein